MINLLIIEGRLTRDPEMKYTQDGMAICNFAIANNQVKKDAPPLFLDCAAFGKCAENIAKFFSKGKPIVIEGSVIMDAWVAKESGEKKTKIKMNVNRFHFVSGDFKKEESNVSENNA